MNPLILKALAVLAAVAAVAGGLWYTYHLGREAGQNKVQAVWQAREIEQQRSYAAALERVRREKDEALAALQADLGKAQATFENQKRRADAAKAENDRVTRDIRAGRLVLRDPGGAAPGEADRGAGAADPAASPGGDGATDGRGRLSAGLAEFLWSEAARADALVEDLEGQLALAQDVIGAYYRSALSCRKN